MELSKVEKVVRLDFQKADESGRKPKYSNFLVTMNTNVRMSQTQAEALAPKLYDMADVLFNQEDNFKRYIRYLDKQGDWTLIDKIKTTAKVEIGQGAKGSRLHLHCGIKVKHYSKIHLKLDKIFLDANTALQNLDFPFPIKNIHVSAHKPDIADYLDK